MKLRETIKDILRPDRTDEFVDRTTDEIMAAIKQWVEDSGYLTGKEWYERFEKEYGHYGYAHQHCVDAVKRASRLKDG